MQANATAWRSGRLHAWNGPPQLLFGRMHEDWSLESCLFPPGGRVLCIASAGCTALALAARGHPVDAVDINPAQVQYVKARLAGAAHQDGAVDYLSSKARAALSWCGLDPHEIRNFLMMENPKDQVRFWKDTFDKGLRKVLMNFALNPLILRTVYSSQFVRSLPSGFSSILRRRFQSGFAYHSNRQNQYVWRLLLGCDPPFAAPTPPITDPVSVICSDAVDYLQSCSSHIYDGFSFSNILDGATKEYARRLIINAERAARPGAVIVLRSLMEPEDDEDAMRAAQDRSMIWGSINVRRVG